MSIVVSCSGETVMIRISRIVVVLLATALDGVTARLSRVHGAYERLPAMSSLSAFEQLAIERCPCRSRDLCLPVDLTTSRSSAKPEVFAFSVTTDDTWKLYDWDKVTTIAWNVDKDLLCHAHSKGVKVVIKHNFDDTAKLCDTQARQEWIQATYTSIVENHADGVNIDTEAAMFHDNARCQSQLVRELRAELDKHKLTEHAQITFDVPWAPRGIDGRFYEWKELANTVDFLFVMAYDMRSQIYYHCIADANSPLMLVKQGLQEFIQGYDIDPKKLVLGVPWYGYRYDCKSFSTENEVCGIEAEPFHEAPCSDAAGNQINYGDICTLLQEYGPSIRRWDAITQSPKLVYRPGNHSWVQLWYDDEASLTLKYALAKTLGLRGVGMWNADTLDYRGDLDGARRMWQAIAAIY